MTGDQFVRETRDGIDRLAEGLLDLESESADERLTELFRIAHTLKGNCSAAGFDAPATVAHALEDVLDAVRADRLAPDRDVVDAALEAVDVLEAMLDEIAADDRVRTEPDATVDALRDLLERRAAADPASKSRVGSESEGDASIDADAIPEPGSGEGLSAAEALERASGLDDLESLSAEVDDDVSLEGGGSFDEVFEDEGDGADGTVADADAGDESPTVEIAGTETAGGEDDGTDFDSLRSDVDVLDAGAMDEALEDVDFGDGAADDDVSVTELLDAAERVDDAEPTPAPDDRGPAEADDGTAETEPSGAESEPDPLEDIGEPTGEVADGSSAAAEDRSTTDDADSVGLDGEDPFAEDDPLAPAEDDPLSLEGADSQSAEGGDSTVGETGDATTPADDTPVWANGESSSSEGGAAGDGSATDDGTTADGSDDPSPSEDGRSAADRAEQAMNAAGIDDQRLVENIQQLEPAEGAEESGSFVFDAEVTTQADGEDTDTEAAVEVEPDSAADDGDDSVSAAAADGSATEPNPDASANPSSTAADGVDEQPTTALDIDPASGGGTDLAPDLEGFDRDANVREFADAFGDSFEGDEAGARTAPDAVTTIPPALLEDPDAAEAESDAVAAVGETITVEGATADRLLRLTERLTTVTMALERGDGTRGEVDDDSERTRELREIATDLEETVTTVRLQPLEGALSGLERTARRVARETNTQVDLATSGESIELDREVVAALDDPLVHLVRNAVDHGIESPEERAAAGKPRNGTVTIDARKDSDEAVLEVRDDGRGLDADDLRRAAVEEGIVTREAAAAMSDGEAHELVFHPGLSTQSDVTDVSGRGVGMDVVADAMAGLDGDIEVESTTGEGTTFRLRVPVSVAATEVLFVEAGGHPYAIPAADIARLEEFDPGRADGDEYAMTVAGEDGPETERRPLVSLSDWLGAPADGEPTVVVHTQARHGGTAIACDDVGDWRRVVVRPYDDLLAATPGIDGATLLGNGDLANVLDVAAIGEGGSR